MVYEIRFRISYLKGVTEGFKILRLFQHTFETHPEQPLPTGYKGIPFIVGQGDCLGCALGVCVL